SSSSRFVECFTRSRTIPTGLLACSSSTAWGAGLYGALFPLIVADLMQGTGRFNVALGAVMTAQGTGASWSTALAGLVVVRAGYSAAFLTLAGIAGAGLGLFWLAMSETWQPEIGSGRMSSVTRAAE